MELPTSDNPVSVVEGEALDVLRALPDATFDAVVTDPPYAQVSEAASLVVIEGYGRSKVRRRRLPMDCQFFEAWIREHLTEWARVLKPTGAVWLTIDWRGALAVDDAAGRLGLRATCVGVWDRGGLGMGGILRHVYECFAVVPMEAFERLHTDEPDLWREPWSPGNRQAGHSAEKPVPLFQRAIRLVSPPGGLILDPFGGSGTTGVAAAKEDCRCVLVEREPTYAAIARRRVADAMGTGLLAGIA